MATFQITYSRCLLDPHEPLEYHITEAESGEAAILETKKLYPDAEIGSAVNLDEWAKIKREREEKEKQTKQRQEEKTQAKASACGMTVEEYKKNEQRKANLRKILREKEECYKRIKELEEKEEYYKKLIR